MQDAGSYEDYLAATRAEERQNRIWFTGVEPAPAATLQERGRYVDATAACLEAFEKAVETRFVVGSGLNEYVRILNGANTVSFAPKPKAEPPKRGQRLTELRAAVERRGRGRQWWLR